MDPNAAPAAADPPATQTGRPPRPLSNPGLAAHLAAIKALPLEELTLTAESQRQEGVPQGTLERFSWTSRVFPGTERTVHVHLPAGHSRTAAPSRFMVFQDGWAYANPDGEVRAPNVFNNLLASGELPPIIGIFIDPGTTPAQKPGEQPVNNRQFEYDSLSDQYVRLLTEEVLPQVGRYADLSLQAADAAICGCSSGGIAAFLAAWYRPDRFSKVLSHVGSFADMNGGHHVHSMVRKHPRKPIRVFLQGACRDLNWEKGDWWLANLEMESALRFAGYDMEVAWSAGNHSIKNGGAILPDSLRWLWRP